MLFQPRSPISRIQTCFDRQIADTSNASCPTPPDKPSAVNNMMAMMGCFQVHQSPSRNPRSEINAYIGLRQEHMLEPVEFWMRNETTLPTLSHIARRLMSIIPSSSGTERTFSVSKRIQGLRRAHMRSDVFENQILIVANGEFLDSVMSSTTDRL